MKDTGAKGLAIAVIENGKELSVRDFGVRNAAGAPRTGDTVMNGASLTKAVFGYLATQLAQENKLQPEESIANIFPRTLAEYTMEGNVNGDGVADLAILVTAPAPIGAGDFVL